MINLKKPNPGSDEAVAMGCFCPRSDNGYGRGSYKGGWIINLSCPVHNTDPKDFTDSVGITH
jgi:hypothetical protein